ncbi:unnamed protein product [Orchesella dallaii]|uniref:Potassium channel domain-containing protein n=1 Tax=Orchesella dallaii TaxID=48710 RepID=A0ABP1Q0E9_9HEXA
MQSYISVNLESSRKIETSKRKSKASSFGTHRPRDGSAPRRRFKYWLRNVITFLFSQVGVGSLLVCYTILGAMLFTSIESTVDNRRLNQVASLRSSVVSELWNVTKNYNVIYGREWKKEVDQIVRTFQSGLVHEIRLGFEGIDAKDPWTFPQALMFSLSVYTTIGYGNLTPKTDWGKATTCIYALFGIPLLLLYMANVGDLLATSFQQFYRTLNRCKRRVNKMRELSKERRRRRRMSLTEGVNEQGGQAIFGVGSHGSAVGDYRNVGHKELRQDREQIGPSQWDPHMNESTLDNNECEANEVTIPISTCLAVFFCYILLGSILFSWWEGWEYFEGSYFCFVSLVTIGFSDMVPGQSRNIASATVDSKSNAGFNSQQGESGASPSNISAKASGVGSNGREESLDHVDGQLILCSIYILFGMALMAMCFHLTQERFFSTAKKLGRALHLI